MVLNTFRSNKSFTKLNKNPLVSILLLSMNHEKFIAQCILSLKEQTYKNIEVVYLDNASGDNTFQVGKKALEESGISYKIFHNAESKGISKNLNFLLENCSGEYVCPLSADDWFDPENIEKKLAFYSQNPNTGALFSNGWIYYDDEKETILNDSSTFKRGYIFKEVLTQPDCLFYVGMMYKREIIERVGKWDEDLLIEDVDMFIRIALIARIDFIDVPLVFYRQTKASVSKNKVLMLKGFDQYYEKYKHLEWIDMQKWLAERYRSVSAYYVDQNNTRQAINFLKKAINLNPFGFKNFRTLLYFIRNSLTI